MTARMPSPIGHALAGVAVVWAADVVQLAYRTVAVRSAKAAPAGCATAGSSPRLTAVCAGLAMLPDADLLLPGAHRTATHSVTAAVVTFIIASVVTGKVTRASVLCGVAYASHLLLDWLSADNFPPRGIQLLWPFSHRWFISDWEVFRQTARQQFLTPPIIRQNLVAVAQEIAILLPIVIALFAIRRLAVKRRAHAER